MQHILKYKVGQFCVLQLSFVNNFFGKNVNYVITLHVKTLSTLILCLENMCYLSCCYTERKTLFARRINSCVYSHDL